LIKGRLAGTVLAKQDMQFAGADIEVDPVEGSA